MERPQSREQSPMALPSTVWQSETKSSPSLYQENLSLSPNHSNDRNETIPVVEEPKEQKGFVVAYHPAHGHLLLLAVKKKKGKHHQLPGGRVDKVRVPCPSSSLPPSSFRRD